MLKKNKPFFRGSVIRSVPVILINIISGASCSCFFFNNFYAGIFLLSGIWVIYSFLVSKITVFDFKDCLHRDFVTYMPLSILSLFYFNKLSVNLGYHSALFTYYLRLFLAAISASGVIFLKVFQLKISREKSAKNIFEVIIYLLVIFTTVFLYTAVSAEFASGSAIDTFRNKLWNISAGNFLIPTANDAQFPAHVFSAHFMPVYFILAFVFKIIPVFNFFYFLIALMLSLGILPIYWFSCRILKDKLSGLVFSLLYILHPGMQFAFFYRPLWEDIFAMPIILFILYFLFTGKNRMFLLFTVFLLLWKESFGIIIATLSIYIILVMKKKRLGGLTFVIGIAWFLSGIFLSRFFNRWQPYNNNTLYQDAVSGFISHPADFLAFIFNPKMLMILFLYLLPLSFLPLLSPELFILGLPYFYIVNVHPAHRHFLEVYHSLLLPFLLFGAIFAVSKINKFGERKGLRLIPALNAMLFSAAVIFYGFLNPFTYLPKARNAHQFMPGQRLEAIRKILKEIPRNSSVYATCPQYYFLPEQKALYFAPTSVLSEKTKSIFSLPDYRNEEVRDAEYVVIDLLEELSPKDWQESSLLQGLINSHDYGVMSYKDGLIIFKRNQKTKLFDFVKFNGQAIENKTDIIFNNLQLLGYNIDKKTAAVGDLIRLTYFWKCLDDIKDDYRVLTNFHRPYLQDFKHLHVPVNGLIPTSSWKKGDIIVDEVLLTIPDSIIANIYPFQMEVYLLKVEHPVNNIPYNEEVFVKSWKKLERSDKLNIKKDNLIGYLLVRPKL